MGINNFDKSGISQVLEGKLYFAVLHRQDDIKASWLPRPAICFSVDKELVYEPFYADFGPLNLACTYRFCWKLQELLKEGELHGRCVCFYCSSDPKKKANSAVLLGAYLVLFEDWDPEVAYSPLALFESYFPFRDPTWGISTYHLSVLDCLRALAKGKRIGWIDFNDFNVMEYEYFEKVENGDLNWIVPNKFVAFSGPRARCMEMCGNRALMPKDYVDYFKQTGVTTVIRLNKRMYDKRCFTDHGLLFYDLYFPDGSCPPERIVQQFLKIAEGSPGSVAVHCKAGLGRTGVLIGCYIMKHYRFTANEVLGYLRVVRPGSVIGPQQHFLRDMQSCMWKGGELMRHQKSDTNRNIRENMLPSACNSVLASSDLALESTMDALSTGTSTYGHGKGNSSGMKKYSANPVVGKTGFSGINESTKVKSCVSKNIGTSNYALHMKERRNLENKVELTNDSRPSGANISHLNPRIKRSTSTRSSNMPSPSEYNASICRDSCSTGTCRKPCLFKENPRPYNLQPHLSLCLKNPCNQGILRNASVDCKVLSADVCTQRITNAAGQPRKVIVPISQSSQHVIHNSSGCIRSSSTSRVHQSKVG